jgi:Tol biopolymer transport system component
MNAHPELDRALSAWLDRELPSHAPDGLLSDAMAEVARTSRRSSWRVPERWIPMPITLRLVVVPRAAMLLLLTGLLVALAIGVVSVGGRPTRSAASVLPPPNGPAANGLIAYDSAGDIWVVNPDGSDPRQLTTSAALEYLPVWSRDGTQLAYWSQDAASSASRLIVVDADGSNPRVIVTDDQGRSPDNGLTLDWAPDGQHVAYSLGIGERAPRPDEHVYVAAVDGSGVEQMGDPTLIGRKPTYSPDGATIAFTGSREGAAEEGPYPEQGTYLMSLDGDDVRRLTTMDAETQFEFFRAEWSPDGTNLATSIGGDVWVIAADGTGERKVTEPYQEAIAPRWSPDGTRLLYASNIPGGVRVISAEGGDYVLLGQPAPYGTPGHLWSPDGALVAVGQLTGGENVLAIIDAVSGDVLAEVPTPDLSFPAGIHNPSWQRLAVAR